MHEQWSSKVTMSASPSHSKISWVRGRSPGWAAFDLKQKGKQGLEPEVEIDGYPPVASSITALPPLGNAAAHTSLSSSRSFSSVLQPLTEFPVLVGNSSYAGRQIIVGGSSTKLANKVEEKTNAYPALVMLKKLHSWADDSLIEDVLGAVSNDVVQASDLLKAMISSGGSEEPRITKHTEQGSLIDNSLNDNKAEEACKDFPSENIIDLAGLRSAFEDCVHDMKTEETSEDIPAKTGLSDDTTHVSLVSQNLIAAPVEPEWEEDDVYLIHRRDAIKAIRSAAQHSRAASNAFMRGDHASAQQLSLKAQEEWMVAEKLNMKAAQEILRIRNCGNDIWKLDLHGLHASEAVHALQAHLWKIETQTRLNRSVSPNRQVKPTKADLTSSSLESLNCMGLEEAKPEKERAVAVSSQRWTVLQVITGTGNHSRGQAALPIAVRSFLNENGYRFDEARPGVIAVRPKFRHR